MLNFDSEIWFQIVSEMTKGPFATHTPRHPQLFPSALR